MREHNPKDVAAAVRRSRRKVQLPPVGSSPGTLIADPSAHAPTLTLTLISSERVQTIENADMTQLRNAWGRWPLVWLDCAGLADIALIEEIGRHFDLHRLALEDTINTATRPKADFYPNCVYAVMTMIDDEATHRYEQISLFFGEGFVVTFQERPGDPFGPVRKRLLSPAPNRLREKKSDYLAYALTDAVVDSYFPLVEKMGDKIDDAEDDLLANVHKNQSGRLHLMRRGAGALKRPLIPIRETVSALLRSDTPLIAAETKIFLSDTLDHATTLMDLVDGQRDMLTGLIDMHLSLSQAKTADIISFLTVISSIFIPLTFLVGIWGMNFDTSVSRWNMPELEWAYGYPAALGFMLVIALLLLGYFKWRRWL
ncbi:MAG: magnesium/cobalt transporter CorA [Mesorhizobium sp.]